MEGPRRTALFGGANHNIEGKINPAGFIDHRFWNGFEIAGDAFSLAIGQEINAAAALGTAALDGVNDAGQAENAVLIGKSLNLCANGCIGLPGEQSRRVPEDIGQNRAHGERENQEIDCR